MSGPLRHQLVRSLAGEGGRPNLTVVADNSTDLAHLAELELKALFASEADVLRRLADVRRSIDAARIAYANSQHLAALPRVELLRTRFGPSA